MTARLNPYLAFESQARPAMEFYASVFGGPLNLMTFGDMGGMGMPENQHHLVMHADLMVSDSVTLMGSDQPGSDHINSAISLSGDEDAVLRGWWDALAEGGTVKNSLEAAPWGDVFGQLIDRFGIHWMFNIAGPGQ